jgi:mono/diheme cytochrome c family protein
LRRESFSRAARNSYKFDRFNGKSSAVEISYWGSRTNAMTSNRSILSPAVAARPSQTTRLAVDAILLMVGGLGVGCEAPELPQSATVGDATRTPEPATTAAQESLRPAESAQAENASAAAPQPSAPGQEAAPPVENSLASAAPDADQIVATQGLLVDHGCMKCHRIDTDEAPGAFGGPPPGGFGGPPPREGGPGGPPPGGPEGRGGPPPGRGFGGPPRGPNLAHVGANPEHTAEWIADHIRDPKSHNPRSRMPAFADKMSDDEIQQAASYLATLK